MRRFDTVSLHRLPIKAGMIRLVYIALPIEFDRIPSTDTNSLATDTQSEIVLCHETPCCLHDLTVTL